MDNLFRKPRLEPRRRVSWTGILACSATALLCYLGVARLIESDARARFADHAHTAQHAIAARIKSYTDLLRAAASVLNASAGLTPAQLRAYEATLSLTQYFPALESINYAEYVREDQRAAFEQRMLAQTSGADPAVTIRPAGTRTHYAVITLFEPRRPWYGNSGYDLLADEPTARLILAGRDSGALLSSGLAFSLASTPNRPVLALRLPVYRRGMPTADVGQRRAAFAGSVGIFFSVQKLLGGVLDEMAIRKVGITLVDAGAPAQRGQPADAPRLLFDSRAGESAPVPAESGETFGITLPIDFHGRQWDTTFSVPKSTMYTGFDAYFPWMAMLAGFVSAALVYALIDTLASSRVRAITMAHGLTGELRASQARLEQSLQTLRRLAAHADRIKEGERKRIAHTIEADLGQNLLDLHTEAQALSVRSGHGQRRLHGRASSSVQQIVATSKSVRQIIDDLRPSALDLGLNAAIAWQVDAFRGRSAIACELADHCPGLALDDLSATALFRILQESLSNVARHSHADTVKVALTLEQRQLTMTVCDDGVGIAPGAGVCTGSFGLIGIEERITILGGTFSVATAPGAGTTVRVSIPVPG